MVPSQYFHLANVRILLALNHWLSGQPDLYFFALQGAARTIDLLALATLAWLWFWPDPQARAVTQPLVFSSRDEKGTSGAKGSAKIGALFKKVQSRARRSQNLPLETVLMRPTPVRISRLESRSQVLIFGAAALLAYVAARLLALYFNVERPFITYLPIHSGVESAFDGLRQYGSFPSDYAILLGALPTALRRWNRHAAWAWWALALVYALLAMALGLHYPADLLGGFIIGAAFVSAAFYVYEQQGQVHDVMDYIARAFDLSSAPYCYILYFFLGVIGLEFLMHFQHILDVIYSLRGTVQARVTQ